MLSLSLLLLCMSFGSVAAWDNDDLEIFDLVELINQNFYKFMGIQQVRRGKHSLRKCVKLTFRSILGCFIGGGKTSVSQSFNYPSS